MNQKEIKELIDYLVEKDIAEFELERGDVKLRVKRGGEAVVVPAAPVHAAAVMPVQVAPVAPPPPVVAAEPPPASRTGAPPPAAAEAAEEAGLHVIRSPIVGTFYEAASPGAPPFVKVGDTVAVGQVLCIIEAMKLMNEIESDYAGEIAKKYVSNAQPVEYGQPLFAVRA
jgi:acetyl-CoA carboxylase biotin carboxyl carrier protein